METVYDNNKMTVFFEVSVPNCSKLMKQAVTYCLRVCWIWQIHVGREGAVHPSVQTMRALGGREETRHISACVGRLKE
jgi:hypothetical protein